MRTDLKLKLPDNYNEQQLISKLAEHYSIKKKQSLAETFDFYDTFDWRLFNNSLVLYESTGKIFLRKLYENVTSQSTQITSPPVFIRDFPDGQLKEVLAPIIKMRALLKLAQIYYQSTLYHILNQDQKTVVRLVYEEIRPSHNKHAPALAVHFWLKPVRGYTKYSSKLAKRLREAGLLRANKKEDIYFKALQIAGKKPGSYSSKVHIQLDPHLRSDEATKTVLKFLLQVIRINESNIPKDLDTEFLHDFRVAVRRTRSALDQIKNVFASEITDRFMKDFAFVGKLSNQLRDLDVYLLNEDTYRALLPAACRHDIDPLFDYLRKKRSKALQEVITGLKSRKYAKIMQDWEDFLNEALPDSPVAYNADRPIIDLARERIFKKYRNVVKTGILILENTEDKMLHALRIECKKLRYLMEFFSSLFPLKKINILIQQLKKLQDNLGDFNDLCVQEEYLFKISEELSASHQQFKKTLVAIGTLIGALNRERQAVKDAFAETFTKFASPANRKLFRELFASKS